MADRVRIAEAFRVSDQLGERVWPEWRDVPFAVLLVTPEREFLLRHPRPSADFTRLGYDSLLRSDVFVRRRVFSPTLQATFPAVSGVATVVMGDAEHTGLRSTAWVLTLLHEHFHQLQTAHPGYFEGVDALRLARGDTTGMWMLNYAFPYDSAPVAARFADFTHAAAALVAARAAGAPHPSRTGERTRITRFLAARDRLRAALSADDYRYLAFQLWQEGVARYTEYALARLAAARYRPTAAFRALPDYQPFDSAALAIYDRIATGTRQPDLPRAKRVALYPAGAAVALLLDDTAPGWRRQYLARPFSLDTYLDAGAARPTSALGWLAGCWERRSGEQVVEEQWMAPRAGMLLGVGRTTRGDSIVEHEFVRIYEAGDTLVYAARPSGQEPAEFRAAPPHRAADAVTFENAAHDFPQRVMYRRVGADSLVARIEGTRRGVVRGTDFAYRRVPCGTGATASPSPAAP